MESTDIRLAELRKCWDLIGEGKMCIKNKRKLRAEWMVLSEELSIL